VAPLNSGFSWTEGQSIVTTVTVGPKPATNILVNAGLVDTATGAQFGGGDLVACQAVQADPKKPDCTPVTSLQPNTTQRVYIRPKSGMAPFPGKYTGTVQLTANEGKSDGAQFTINVTTGGYLALGVFMVALGTLLSMIVTVGVRNRMVRLQMIRSVEAVLSRLTIVELQLAGCKGDKTPSTTITIGNVRTALSIGTLDAEGLLPRSYSVNAAGFADAADFKDRLDNAAAWVTVLGHVVNLGFAQLTHLAGQTASIAAAAGIRAATPGAAAGAGAAAALAAGNNMTSAIAAAWQEIDALAESKSGQFEPAPDLSATDTQIAGYVASVTAVALTAAGPIGGGPSKAMDSERLNVQINVLSFASWALAALLTTLVGSYVMVLSHLDFGSPGDLWLCLFWGFGLPTVTQLSQATPTSIAGSVGVTLPK
jgi:hypothetical protein